MMESTAPRRGILWLTVLALAFTVVVFGADQASAAKPDPQVTFDGGQAVLNRAETACNYTTSWTVSGINGKWALIQVEVRAAGAPDWSLKSLEKVDIRANPTVVRTTAIFGDQPEALEVRFSVVKNNGSVEATATSAPLTCELTPAE